MRRSPLTVPCALITLFAVGIFGIAEAQGTPRAYNSWWVSPTMKFGTAWQKAAWKEPDFYADVWRKLKQQKLTDRDVRTEYERLQKVDSVKSSEDAYRLGYFIFRAYYISPAVKDLDRMERKAAYLMAQHQAASSAEFARLRVRLEMRSFPSHEMIPVLRRLAKRFSTEASVELELAYALVISQDHADQDEGIQRAEAVLKTKPDNLRAIWVTGDAYGMTGPSRKDEAMKAKAVTLYQRAKGFPGLSKHDIDWLNHLIKALTK